MRCVMSFDSFVRNRLKVKLLFIENLPFLFILYIQTSVMFGYKCNHV